MKRSQRLARLTGGHFNVLVIGGGITGAGTAWDCALRGLSVALLERTDFAAGTSGVSSKMAHAGIRYISNDADLVSEAGLERERLFAACRHLARPVEYLLPVYGDTPPYDGTTLRGTLERYDELCGADDGRRSRMADPREILAALPALRPAPLMVGSYRDGVMDDARITLEVILAAEAAGATVLNHAAVTAFIRDAAGQLRGARFRDESPGGSMTEHTVSADVVVSAVGPYTDLLLHMAGEGGAAGPALRPSKGMHLIFKKRLTSDKAVVIPAKGNVLYFLIPFQPGYLAMGCTDLDYPVRDYADLDHVPVEEEEIVLTMDLLETVFPGVFSRSDIVAIYSGVRPLVRPEPVNGRLPSETETSRAHRIWKTEGGLWAIAGGKFTTFRMMAEQLVDGLVADLAGRGIITGSPACSTVGRRYHGAPQPEGTNGGIEHWLAEETARLKSETGLPDDCCRHLCETYGTSVGELAALIREDPALGARIGEGRPFVLAEITHAVQSEMCLGAGDFLIRRTSLRFREHQGLDVLETVVSRLAGLLGWSSEVRGQEAEDYRQAISRVWSGSFD
ncbi:MAG: glycerol-3-phosphate dehydrogenase/oxidase [Spirochaetia bacterium]